MMECPSCALAGGNGLRGRGSSAAQQEGPADTSRGRYLSVSRELRDRNGTISRMFLKRTTFVRVVLVGLALAVVLPYARGPVYRFPAPVPFAGATLLNPYAAPGATWQRANLHAHGRAWSGLTNGRRQSDEEIVRAYRSFGYSVAGVSDYHHIAAFDGVATLPIYEHGYNIGKRHQLAIGAREVSWFDFPLGQTRSHQQFVID